MSTVNEHGWINDNPDFTIRSVSCGMCAICEKMLLGGEWVLCIYTGSEFWTDICLDCLKSGYKVLSEVEKQRRIDALKPKATGM